MPVITVDNVPAELQQRLEERAARHRRSLDREVLETLKASFNEPYRIPPVKPYKGKFPLTQDWLDWARREGRE